MKLGLRAEFQGDPATAEKDLREAVRVDKQYDPRWTLVNFYFRQQRAAEFWQSMSEVLNFEEMDLRPAFELCWNFTNDPRQIERVIPGRERVLHQYLSYTIATTRPEAAALAARELVDRFGARDVDMLAYYCRWTGSVEIWNALCRRHLVPFQPVDADKGQTLADGDFTAKPEVTPAPRAFQWTLPNPDIYTRRLPRGLRIDLSGNQPEACDLLAQSIPVVPKRAYRLRFEYQTAGLPPKTGLRWKAEEGQADLTAAEEWKGGEMLFHASGQNLTRLVLSYARIPGTTRTEGSISLRGLAVEFAE